MYSKKRRSNNDFDFFITLTEKCTRRELASLMSSPLNRLPQYLIFLGALYQKSDHTTEYAHQIFAALKALQETTDSITNFLRDQQQRER